jgi:hypothetical protein
VRIQSKRLLNKTVIRPASAVSKIVHDGDHTLSLLLDGPRKFSLEPEGRKGPTPHVLSLRGTNLTIEGITIRGASHWTVVPRHCSGSVQNVQDGFRPLSRRWESPAAGFSLEPWSVPLRWLR